MPWTPRTPVSAGDGLTSVTVSAMPTGWQQNDFLLLVISEDNNVTGAALPTPPTGYTRLVGTPNSASNPVFRASSSPDGETLHAYWKIAGASESPPSYVASQSGNSYSFLAWSGVDTTIPLDVTPSDVSAAGAASPVSVSLPSITTVTSGALLIWIAGPDCTVATDPTAVTVPGGFTQRVFFNGAAGAAQFTEIAVADFTQTTAGATGAIAGSFTLSSGTAGPLGYLIALRPAAVVPGITRQPDSTNVVLGQTATFSIEATNATSYQWQDNSSGSFVDIGGATSPSYTTAATTSAFQRRQYRCKATNANGTTTTSAASLTLTFNDVYLYAMPEDADPDDVRLRDPTQAAAGGTHATTGALAADAATLAGTAAHSALHATSGALASQDAAIAGTAAHLTLHATSGALSAQAATVAGTAAHQHATTGALSAQAAAIAGTAAHATLHTSTGALTAQAATIAGTAADEHSNTGALTAQAATIAGTADHRTLHTTTGALSAADASIAGTAAHENATTGALTAQDATIAGTADHRTLHATTGALSAQAATITGAAQHQHAATGALAAQDAAISGAADHTTAGASHSTSGTLAAQDATLAGSAEHLTLHTTSGALTAQASSIAGTAAHQHVATGALAAQDATVDGAAAHLLLHTSTGALAAAAATISGAAAHEHASTGALAAQAATVDGAAVHSAAGTHDATGALAAGEASMSGLAEHVGTDDGLLDPKLIARKRKPNQNITFKGAGGQAPRKKREEVPEPVKAKASPLLLGLMARGLAAPTPTAPPLPEPAPVLDVASIAQAMLAAAIEVPKPEVPLTLEQQLAARVEQLERENAQLQAELTALRTPPEPVQATPRDPIHEALHAILPALAEPIDLDALPDEPEEEPPAEAPPVEQPAKMTPEQIEAENKRRALLLTALLT